MFVIACEEDQELREFQKSVKVTETEFPISMSLGDIANLKIYIEYENPCARFEAIESTNYLDSTVLQVFALYKEGNCQVFPTRDSVYVNFEARRLGQHYFHFIQPDGSRYLDTILVN